MRRTAATCSPSSLKSSGAAVPRPNGPTSPCRRAGERYEQAPLSTAVCRAPDDRLCGRRSGRRGSAGRADSQQLSDALARVFGDNSGLSRERAGEVAEYFKTALGLPPEAITYEWVGDTQPIASNLTEEGRTLNRRVEVEVWYDEVRSAPMDEEVLVATDINRIKICRTETLCKMRYKEG